MNTIDPVSNGEMTEHQKKLVEDNLPLVLYTMKKISPPPGFDADEWYSELLLILCRSVIAFDPSRGFKFSTYFMKTAIFTKRYLIRMNYSLKRDIRKTKLVTDDELKSISQNHEPESSMVLVDVKKQLKDLIRLLPHSDWIRIAECKLEGYNGREIGEMMKRPKNSVNNSWLMAIAYMQRHIKAKNLEMAG